MKRLLQLFDQYFIFIGALFLLAFIPLYPKIPLIHVIRTWVYVRFEDFAVAFLITILGIQFLRKKTTVLRSPLTFPIVLYWIVGLCSLLFSLAFIGPHLQGYFPHIAILFYLRGIEYMLVFFLAFAGLIQNRNRLNWVVVVLVVTVLSVVIYGVGQKFYGFPAYLTMNEEFAKGVPLRLPPTARIASTFAGHYDLAAYLVLTIPILGSLIFGVKKKILKLLLLAIGVSAFLTLLFTASRVSFGMYLIAISTMLWWQKKRLLIIPVLVASVVMVNFVSGASDRFFKTFRFNDVVVDLSTGQPIGTLDKLENGKAVLQTSESPAVENLPTGSGFISVPTNQGSQTVSESVQSVELVKLKSLAKGSGEVATISGSFLVQKALVLDISITTRLQAEWPKAIQAFQRNVLLGSGYSVLSLASDGNYHRLLGETGILGTISYLGIFLYAFVWFFRTRKELAPFERAFVTGVFAGLVGIMLNAVLIDVFVASKVAYMMWLLLGSAMAVMVKHTVTLPYLVVLKNFLTDKRVLLLYFCVGIFIVFAPALSTYFVGDDFTWLRWAAQTNFSDLPRYFSEAQGFFYRPIPKLWYFSIFSVFWLVPEAYHVGSIVLFIGTSLALGAILWRWKVQAWIIGLVLIVFASLSVHHENVFWISGQSSLLASAFLFSSFYCFIRAWETKQVNIRYYAGGSVLLFLSMLSYDSMMVTPFTVVALGLIGYKRTRSSLPLLLLIPLYWFIRLSAQAVLPSGDYGINTSRLLANGIGNTLTYTMAIFGGPKVIEYSNVVRAAVRSYAMMISVGSAVIIGIIAFLSYKKRQVLLKQRELIVAVLWYFLLLVPFIGLGGVSERYALFASGAGIVILGLLVQRLMKKPVAVWLKMLPVLILAIVIYWNIGELQRLGTEWQFAGNVTKTALSSIKQQFFPPKTIKTFVFIDTPIRYGRAWIFPTGLNDALWHMFRTTPYYTVPLASIDDAFSYKQPVDTDRIILDFTDYQLNEVVKETVTPMPTPPENSK